MAAFHRSCVPVVHFEILQVLRVPLWTVLVTEVLRKFS